MCLYAEKQRIINPFAEKLSGVTTAMQKSRLRKGWVKKYDQIANKKGSTWSEDGNKTCFMYIYHRLLEETEIKEKGKELDYYNMYNQILNECVDIFSRRREDLKKLFEHYELNDVVLNNIELKNIFTEQNQLENDEDKEDKTIYKQFSQQMIMDIEKIILESNRAVKNNESKEEQQCGATTTLIKRYLKEKHGYDVDKRKLLELLHSLGYEWGKLKYNGLTLKTDRKERVRKFLYEYSLALQEEQKGDAIIVYTDETYINTRHQVEYSWYSREKPETTVLAKRFAPWARYIVLHAMSKDGLIKTKDNEGKDIHIDEEIANELEEQQSVVFTAEKIWISKKKKGDYHKNVTSKLFMEWLNNRLIPTFKKMYGEEKKMILVMDNAGAHTATDKKKIIPSKMTKEEIYEELKKRDIQTVQVRRVTQKESKEDDETSRKTTRTSERIATETAVQSLMLLADEAHAINGTDNETVDIELQHIPLENWKKRAEGTKISKEEMAEQLQRVLEERKENYDEKSIVEEEFEKRGWQVLWTPPSHPVFQPIELLWAYIKHYVRRKYHTKRNERELLQDIRESLDGVNRAIHAGVSKTLCERLIAHVKKICNVYIEGDEKLEGNIDYLRCLDVNIINGVTTRDDNEETTEKETELDDCEMD